MKINETIKARIETLVKPSLYLTPQGKYELSYATGKLKIVASNIYRLPVGTIYIYSLGDEKPIFNQNQIINIKGFKLEKEAGLSFKKLFIKDYTIDGMEENKLKDLREQSKRILKKEISCEKKIRGTKLRIRKTKKLNKLKLGIKIRTKDQSYLKRPDIRKENLFSKEYEIEIKASISYTFKAKITYSFDLRQYEISSTHGHLKVIESENTKIVPLNSLLRFTIDEYEPIFKNDKIITIKRFKINSKGIHILDYVSQNENNTKNTTIKKELEERLIKENTLLKHLKGKIVAKVVSISQGDFQKNNNKWEFTQFASILIVSTPTLKDIKFEKIILIKLKEKARFNTSDIIEIDFKDNTDFVDGITIDKYRLLNDNKKNTGIINELVNKEIAQECERRNNLQTKKIAIYGLDIDEYFRCPYRLSVYEEKGLKPMDLLKSDFVKAFIIKPGQEFEDKVMSMVEWKKSKVPLKELIKQKVTIKQPLLEIDGVKLSHEFSRFNIPLNYFELLQIKFVGRPDIIVPVDNVYAPLDIKHHSSITKTDILRITYYTLLLKNFLFPSANLTKGFILLKGGEIKEINTSDYQVELLNILREINSSKRGGSEPKFCSECRICFNYDNCIKLLENNRGLSLVYQIGPNREQMLKEIGITKIEQLAKEDPAILKSKLLNQFPSRGWVMFGGGADIFYNMVMYARALVDRKVIPISKPVFPNNLSEVYLDLEYSPGGQNFLYGVSIKNKGKIKHYQFFCEDEKNKLEPAKDFINLLKKIDNYVIYTWAGISADFPQIRLDLKEIDNSILFEQLSNRHIDLYKLSERCLALPLYSYSIKEVIPYLKIPEKETNIKDGFGCLISYYEYLKTKDEKIKLDILEYNLEDLKKLILVKEWIQNFLSKHDNLPKTYPFSNSRMMSPSIK